MEPVKATGSSSSSDVASPTDGQLVQQAVAGTKSAYDELVRRYQRQCVAVSYRLLGNTNDALEVTQDALLKAYTSLPTLEQPEAFRGWLMRIVSNLSLNYRRSRKTRSQLPLNDILGPTDSSQSEQSGGVSDWMGREDDPLHGLQSKEMGVKLQEALQQLPEKQRAALVLFTIEQMPQQQVAETLNCSVEAVKWHVFQGRKKLKELMKEYL